MNGHYRHKICKQPGIPRSNPIDGLKMNLLIGRSVDLRAQRLVIVILSICYCVVNFSSIARPAQESNVQDPGIETTVRGLLESPRPQDRAWGAYLIGNEGLKIFYETKITELTTRGHFSISRRLTAINSFPT